MLNKKEKIIDKIVKKNYNNELEEVLEKKLFDEHAKNLLLSILYKIEAGYEDYEKVKVDTIKKDEYIKKFISIIDKNCDNIKIVKLKSEESEILGNKTFLVDKENKRIICYPIERKLLYCIYKISKNTEIINNSYEIIRKPLSNLINTGKWIEQVVVLRDFNGYSWTTVSNEMESIEHNLIFQNLRLLLGNKFLENWVENKEFIIEGVLRDSLDFLLNVVDQIIFLDYPSKITLKRVKTRYLKQKLGLEKCDYVPDKEMYNNMINWAKNFDRDKLMKKLSKYNKKLLIIRNDKELKVYYKYLEKNKFYL